MAAPAYLYAPFHPPTSRFSSICSQEFHQPGAIADRFVRDLWSGFWGPFMKSTVEPLSASLRITACIRRKVAQDRVNAMREAAAEEARNVDEVSLLCRRYSVQLLRDQLLRDQLLRDQLLTPSQPPPIPHQPLRTHRLTGSTSA